MTTSAPTSSRHYVYSPPYELFIGVVSLLAILNVLFILLAQNQVVDQVLFVIEIMLSFIFLVDFVARLLLAPSRRQYFLRQFGWADLLSVIPVPVAKLLRVFCILRVEHMIRHRERRLISYLVERRAQSAMLFVIMLVILIAEFGGIGIAFTEGGAPGANITSGADAIWYVFVTITTVGYGDYYPVTEQGRLIGLVIMFAGVSVFAVFTGYVVNLFFREPLRRLDNSLPATDPRRRLAQVQEELEDLGDALDALRKKIGDIERDL